MKRLLCVLIVILGLSWAASPCQGQWGIIPRAGGQSAQMTQGQACEQPHPAVARITVWTQGAREKGYGTAVLIFKRGGKAAVVTAQHLFRGVRKPVVIIFEFPNGEKFEGTMIDSDDTADLAIVSLDAPSAEPIQICPVASKPGDKVTVAGYGKTGCYRTTSGIVTGFGRMKDGKNHYLMMTGGSRMGDSGGPMLNVSGELVGVLSLTNDAISVGAFNGRLCQFLSADRPYLVPWNAKLAGDNAQRRADALVQVQPPQPMTVLPGPMIDVTARGMANEALSRVASLEKSVGASAASIAGASKAATAAATKASEAIAGMAGIEETIGDKIVAKTTGLIKPAIMAMLTPLIPWGIGGTVVLGLGGWFLRKKGMAIAQKVDWLTDKTPWTWDDRLLDPAAYKAASLASGKPIPKYANTPGMDPYGNPYPGYEPPQPPSNVPPQPAMPSVKPPAAAPAASMESRIAAAEARVDDLEAKGTA